jgi:hypothetical protein
VEDAPEVLFDWLQHDGLAVSLTGNLARDSETLARHRMLGTGTGIGNSMQSHDQYIVASHDRSAVVRLSWLGYTFWTLCDGYGAVGTVVEAIAAQRQQESQHVYDAVFAALAPLLSEECAILDRARTA